jgi:hypothetical protein
MLSHLAAVSVRSVPAGRVERLGCSCDTRDQVAYGVGGIVEFWSRRRPRDVVLGLSLA